MQGRGLQGGGASAAKVLEIAIRRCLAESKW